MRKGTLAATYGGLGRVSTERREDAWRRALTGTTTHSAGTTPRASAGTSASPQLLDLLPQALTEVVEPDELEGGQDLKKLFLFSSVQVHFLLLEPDHLLEQAPGFRLRHILKGLLPETEPDHGTGPVQLHPVLLEGHHDLLKRSQLLRGESQASLHGTPEPGVETLLQLHPLPLPTGRRSHLGHHKNRHQAE